MVLVSVVAARPSFTADPKKGAAELNGLEMPDL